MSVLTYRPRPIERFHKMDYWLKLYSSHQAKGKCVPCKYMAPTMDLKAYCAYGAFLIGQANKSLTEGWERMSFFDGDPEPFSLDRPRYAQWMGSLFRRRNPDRSRHSDRWRYWCSKMVAWAEHGGLVERKPSKGLHRRDVQD